MKIKRFLLRYYPPGIFIEYMKSNGDMLTKSIDLVQLSFEYFCKSRTNVDELVEEKMNLKLTNQRNDIMREVKKLIQLKPAVVSRPKTPEKNVRVPTPTSERFETKRTKSPMKLRGSVDRPTLNSYVKQASMPQYPNVN